jgi:hypothetical protein
MSCQELHQASHVQNETRYNQIKKSQTLQFRSFRTFIPISVGPGLSIIELDVKAHAISSLQGAVASALVAASGNSR